MRIDYTVTRAYKEAMAEKFNKDPEVYSEKRRAFNRRLNTQYTSNSARQEIMAQLENEFGSLLAWK